VIARMHTADLPLADARALIARAIDKAEDIAMRGGIAVVGASGALVSASRMDHGGAGGMARARSKAWIAATQQIRSTEHLHRLSIIAPPMVAGFSACSPEAVFPGAGGMPIREDDIVTGGMAASGAGIGPFVDYPGADRAKLAPSGHPANGEDLLVHYALDLPYEGQHGDDEERWLAAFGELPAERGPVAAIPASLPHSRQPEHAWALALADRAIAAAAERGERVSVAVADHRGDPIQQDRMDGAPTAGEFVALAAAAAAASFQCPSEELPERYAGALEPLARALPFAVLPVAGGLPVDEDGVVVAGLGIGGAAPAVAAAIAADALAG
jgi:uncharacterized protein GlcG (DUF336 family)